MKGFCLHLHHDIVFEWCHDYDERVAYIKANKPKGEIELRLKLFQPVRGQLPQDLIRAGEAYSQACEVHNQTWGAYRPTQDVYNQEWKAYIQALEVHQREIFELHNRECPNCPWDGKTIFPDKT